MQSIPCDLPRHEGVPVGKRARVQLGTWDYMVLTQVVACLQDRTIEEDLYHQVAGFSTLKDLSQVYYIGLHVLAIQSIIFVSTLQEFILRFGLPISSSTQLLRAAAAGQEQPRRDGLGRLALGIDCL